MKIIQTKVLYPIQGKVLLRGDFNYTYISNQKSSFLTTCLFFDRDIDAEIALNLRHVGGLIGINNSTLDSLLKCSKFLKLHDACHEATDFV